MSVTEEEVEIDDAAGEPRGSAAQPGKGGKGKGRSRRRFAEKASHEAGFADVYDRSLHKLVGEVEAERQGRVNRLVMVFAGLFIAAVVIAAAFSLANLWVGVAMLVVLVIAASTLSMVIFLHAKRQFSSGITERVMPVIADFMPDTRYEAAITQGLDPAPFVDQGLIPDDGDIRLDHHFVGTHRTLPFEVAEARIEKRGTLGTRVLFNGLLLTIVLPEGPQGRVRLTSALGRVGTRLLGQFMDATGSGKASTGDAKFQEVFHVEASDKLAVRSTLTTEARANLLALAEAVRPQPIRCVIEDGVMLLSLPVPSAVFHRGDMMKPVTRFDRDVRALLHDATIMHRVIEILVGERHARVLQTGI